MEGKGARLRYCYCYWSKEGREEIRKGGEEDERKRGRDWEETGREEERGRGKGKGEQRERREKRVLEYTKEEGFY